MQKLPNAENAVVPIEKLRDYCLNPHHAEGGSDKARVFRAALGLTRDDAEHLREMILEAARTHDATPGKMLSHGQMYILDFETEGLKGNVTIRTAWIVERETGFPRLVTSYVN